MSSSITIAIYQIAVKVLALILDKGADVDLPDKLGVTPAHLASKHGHTTCLQLLVKRGADVNKKNVGGDTPLDLARLEWNIEQILLCCMSFLLPSSFFLLPSSFFLLPSSFFLLSPSFLPSLFFHPVAHQHHLTPTLTLTLTLSLPYILLGRTGNWSASICC
jgi:hypothetical protein